MLLQDSEIWGGANQFSGWTNTVIALRNNLFNRGSYSQLSNSRTNSLSVSNNLYQSVTGLLFWPANSNVWSAYNNLFDSCTFSTVQTIAASGYNAYYNCNRQLSPTNASDITLTNAIAYQSGPLGDFYQLTNSLLIDKGSCTAAFAGLFNYCITTNEVKEAASIVDIGCHYVACDSNGNPIDSNSDGIPDYLSDLNGNGIIDFGEMPFGITIDNPANGSVINK